MTPKINLRLSLKVLFSFLLAALWFHVLEISHSELKAAPMSISISPQVIEIEVGQEIQNLYSITLTGISPSGFALYSHISSTNSYGEGVLAPSGLSFSFTTGLMSGIATHQQVATKYWILDEDGNVYDSFTLTIALPDPVCPISIGEYFQSQDMDVQFDGSFLGSGVSNSYPMLRVNQIQSWLNFSDGLVLDQGNQIAISLDGSSNQVSVSNLPALLLGEHDVEYQTSAENSCISSITVVENSPDPTLHESFNDQTVEVGDEIVLSVSASFEDHIMGSFQWKKGLVNQEVDLVDDAKISGSTTSQLLIRNSELNDAGRYVVTISSTGEYSHRTSVSLSAQIEVRISPTPVVEEVADVVVNQVATTQQATASNAVSAGDREQVHVNVPAILERKTLPRVGAGVEQILLTSLVLLFSGLALIAISRKRSLLQQKL